MRQVILTHRWENVGTSWGQNQRWSLHGQRCCRPQELTFPLHIWGCSFHICGEIPDPRRSLTNGENSLVYSSVLMCKYLVVCFEAQTSTNHAVGISQSHQHWQLIYVDLDVKFLMFVWVFKQIFISRVVLKNNKIFLCLQFCP